MGNNGRQRLDVQWVRALEADSLATDQTAGISAASSDGFRMMRPRHNVFRNGRLSKSAPTVTYLSHRFATAYIRWRASAGSRPALANSTKRGASTSSVST